MKKPLLSLAAVFLVSTASRAQQVLIVDQAGGPGGQFTDLQVAIDAAAEGDTLLIRTGFYINPPFSPPLTIDGKRLSLVEDKGAHVVVSTMYVRNIGVGQSVTLRGLDFEDNASLRLETSAGIIWIEDSHFGFNLNAFSPSLLVSDCAAVHINRSFSICSGTGLGISSNLQMSNSSVHLVDSDFIGCNAGPFAPSAMSAAIQAGGYLFLSGTTLQGGAGCGGSGLVMQGTAPLAEVFDSVVLAGSCTSGTPDIDLQSGSVTLLPGDARSFQVASPALAASTTMLTFDGNPGDLIFLDISFAPGSINWPFTTGIWQLDLASYYQTQFFGVIPPGGSQLSSVALPPSSNPIQVWLQVDYFDPVSQLLTLSGGSHLLILP